MVPDLTGDRSCFSPGTAAEWLDYLLSRLRSSRARDESGAT